MAHVQTTPERPEQELAAESQPQPELGSAPLEGRTEALGWLIRLLLYHECTNNCARSSAG